MERSSAFTAVPGWGGVAMGFSALIAAYIAAQRLTSPAQPAVREWFQVWIYECLLGIAIGGATLWRKSQSFEEPLFEGAGRKFLLSFAPPILAGALVSYALSRSAPWLVPGVWLLMYGTAVVAAGTFSVKIVPVMGFCFMAAGAIALFLPLPLANMMLGAGFGGLHIVFGFLIARKFGG